ncbi:3-oxoadipyl-CoA/3-oxo-5,6-dehydrosuberyl-CoA thiolase [Microbacterium ginsengisoli]|uniref:acetyl-CoA C-acetyltransferase n=1 Tax=Microbacterium ginsengisoli TaxID=400772 RepID=A0A0F0LYW3_9MICO|nr:3-oxoadipyl-CoA/3-oxo-5,6-dehydrosuberyl-CoA thiolase [Microbacterium ginsengisoli]
MTSERTAAAPESLLAAPDQATQAAITAEITALFAADGSVTAGNSSSINDGASAVLLAAEGEIEAEPLARIAGRATHGVDPDVFPIAPIEAANKALAAAGRTWADGDVVELNEAFASQSLACIAGWPDLDPAKVNVHGGAIAIGHPLGASGGRVLGHAAHELARRGGGVAVAALCIGVGQGLAVVLER